jgi:acetylornithine deacetylase
MTEEYYRNLFETLLAIDATTDNEFEIAMTLKDHHQEQGDTIIEQEVEKNRYNIFSFQKSDIKKNRVLFTSHIDTVPPHLEWTHDKTKDLYHGRGACDTKGGIIAQLMAGEELRKLGYVVDFLWVVGEEVNHIGAIHASEYYMSNLINDYQHKMVILCEPTDNRLSVGQKGILKAHITFKGKMAHSGYPHLGEDANKSLIKYCSDLYALADSLTDDDYGQLDVNIGLISAGRAANVVSDKAELTLLARTNSNHDLFCKEMNDLLPKNADIEIFPNASPLQFEYVKELNYKNTYVAKFNTDVLYLRKIANVYLMGPGYIINAHSNNEHIYFHEMMTGKDLYIKLVSDVFQKDKNEI